MSSFRIRPRFKHLVQADKQSLIERLQQAVMQDEVLTASLLSDHLYIRIGPADRHSWSPQLDLTFEQDGDQVVVRGLYGPNPTLWAFFFFGYVALGILTLFIGMWGFSLYSLDQDASILWFIPGFGAAALALYLISQTGQKLGAQQMFDIHHVYEDVVKGRVVIH